MPVYTAVNNNGSNTSVVALSTTNEQVTVQSNSFNFSQFVQSTRTENVVLANALIITPDINQLAKPINYIKLDAGGNISAKPHFPFLDLYGFQSQIVLTGDSKMIFNGLNSIQYTVNPNTTVRIIFEVHSKGSYNEMLLKNIHLDIMSLLALLDKKDDMREAQEQLR